MNDNEEHQLLEALVVDNTALALEKIEGEEWIWQSVQPVLARSWVEEL